MIYNPLFFSNPCYRSSSNSNLYNNNYTNKYSNNNFNGYYNTYSNTHPNNRPNAFPNSYHTSYSNNYYKYQNSSSKSNKFQSTPEKEIKEKREKHSEPELFEIFGLKLYFDDILLICLIFFLYNEGVKDQYLFISLILLLLT